MASTDGPSLGKAQSQAREWYEPLIVVSIMLGSLYINRHRDFTITPKQRRIPYE